MNLGKFPRDVIYVVRSFLSGRDWIYSFLVNRHWGETYSTEGAEACRREYFQKIKRGEDELFFQNYGVGPWNPGTEIEHTVILGESNSGRTTLVRDIALNQIPLYDIGAKTLYLTDRDRFYASPLVVNDCSTFSEKRYGQNMDDLDSILTYEIEERKSHLDNGFSNLYIFVDFDDFQLSLRSLLKESAWGYVFMNGRHLGIHLIVTLLSYKTIPKAFRRQIKHFISTSYAKVNEYQLKENLRSAEANQEFQNIAKNCKKYEYLVVDIFKITLVLKERLFRHKAYDIPREKKITTSIKRKAKDANNNSDSKKRKL